MSNDASLQTSAAAAEEFLRTHYKPTLKSLKVANKIGRIPLFRLPEKEGFASTNFHELAMKAVEWASEASHVYFHTNVHRMPYGGGHDRGKRETVTAAIGLAVDIDARGPGRNKPASQLCPTVADALWLVREFKARHAPLRPGIVIDSGYGVYSITLFDEPFITESPTDRNLLDSLNRRFHHALQSIATERCWRSAVDFCDLAKVLRLPGTLNAKDVRNVRPVRVVEQNESRFNIFELDRLLPMVGHDGTQQRDKASDSISNAQAASDKRQRYPLLNFSPAEIAAYYAERVPELKQPSHREWWRGPCPIHLGLRDSFSVNPTTGSWRCFSACDRSGSIFDLEQLLTGDGRAIAVMNVTRIVGR